MGELNQIKNLDTSCILMIGNLSSVFEVEPFAEMLMEKVYDQDLGVLLFARGTGDILIDSFHQTLGNAYDFKEREAARGFSWENIVSQYRKGEAGHGAFQAEDGQIDYLTFAPIDYSDWELMLFAPDSVCMQTANANYLATATFGK